MPSPVFKSIFPYTQELLAEYPLMDDARLDQALRNASVAFGYWKKTAFSERSKVLKNVAALLRRDYEKLAILITREMGKVIAEAGAEVEKCAVTADHYADHAELFL